MTGGVSGHRRSGTEPHIASPSYVTKTTSIAPGRRGTALARKGRIARRYPAIMPANGDAETGSAGEQPAEEYRLKTHLDDAGLREPPQNLQCRDCRGSARTRVRI